MEYWAYDGQRHYKVGLNAVVGRPREELSFEPTRFDEMRRGAWDIDAPRARHGSQRRVRVAELPVVARRVRGPALPARRVRPGARARGRARRQRLAPRGMGGHAPGADHPAARCRGSSIPSSARPRCAPTRRAGSARSRSPSCPSGSASRRCTPGTGIRSSPRARRPGPSCACTSGRRRPRRPRRRTRPPTPSVCCSSAGRCSPPSTGCTRRIPVRFPALRICLSEGGIGWVAGLLDRLDHVERYQHMYGTWDGIDLSPADVLQRNFWFCAIEDRSGLEQRHRIGVDHICLESDYPHQDGTWPDTQELFHDAARRLPRRRRAQAHLGERVEAVRLPGAARGAGRSRCVLSQHPTTSRSRSQPRVASCTARGATRTSAVTSARAPPTRTTRSGSPRFEYFDQTTPERVCKLGFDLAPRRR